MFIYTLTLSTIGFLKLTLFLPLNLETPILATNGGHKNVKQNG